MEFAGSREETVVRRLEASRGMEGSAPLLLPFSFRRCRRRCGRTSSASGAGGLCNSGR
jgi:hypothetical protein